MKPQAYSYLRMSTEIQLRGDSRRRQLEASKAYAEKNGLELADGAQLEDIGISAYRGANVREGALGKFLAAVKNGSVKAGSYLLVESIDRLSRAEILAAQALFLSIIQAGINLVTLADQRVYAAETVDITDLIVSLVIMERAHEESKTKSMRVGAAWKNKRAKAENREPMTARCPAWLRLSTDRRVYEVIPQRVEIVRQIFADSAAGLGMYSIATQLNKAGIPAFVGKKGWHRSYLAKVLTSRAVLGEFQPHIKENGARKPEGNPIADYYPAIISNELFYQVQQSRTQRRVGGAGRKGPGYTNLFTGLAQCAYCHSSIAFENKGPGTRGGTYLICGHAQRGLDCTATRWRYRDFEASFLSFVQELDLDSIVNANEDAERRRKLEQELLALRGKLTSTVDLMEKTYAVLNAGGPPEFVAAKLNELTSTKSDIETRLAQKEAENLAFQTRESRFYNSRDEIRTLVQQLQLPPSDDLYKLRAQIASRLKTLVETLLIAPQGAVPIMRRTIEQLTDLSAGENDDVIEHMRKVAVQPEQSRRYFAVGFRDAAIRVVYPRYNDPLSFEQQIVGQPKAIADEDPWVEAVDEKGERKPLF